MAALKKKLAYRKRKLYLGKKQSKTVRRVICLLHNGSYETLFVQLKLFAVLRLLVANN